MLRSTRKEGLTMPSLDLTDLPKLPKFREPLLGESPRAYAAARAEATQKFVREALEARKQRRAATASQEA